MAQIGGHYDQNAEPNDFDQLPAGTYRAKIIESEIVDISEKSDKGRCLKLTWQVETGPLDGRLTWQRLNMWPNNMDNIEKVTSIANSQFASIRQATGKVAPQDSSELHHIPCTIVVGPQKNNPQYNEVKTVKPVEGGGGRVAPGALPQTAPARQPSPGPAANGSAPWPRRQSA